MPKQKTHSGAKKRFKATSNGLYKTSKSGKSHILTKKTPKRKARLRQGGYVDETKSKEMRKLLPYQ